MGDVDQGLGLALGFLGIALPVIGHYIDIPTAVRYHRHAELHLWATISKLCRAKSSLNTWSRGSHASEPSTITISEDSMGATADTLHNICADIERELATILLDPSDSTNTDTLDPEAQLPPKPRFSSHLVKLKWSLGDNKQVLETKVDVFCEQVAIYNNRSSPIVNPALLSPTPGLSAADQAVIWFTDFRGTVREFNIELCRGVGSFILCLFLEICKESLDPHVLAALLKGEFWVVAEDQHDMALESSSSHGVIRSGVDERRGAILADTWEKNVRPGRKFKMIMSTGDTDHSSSAQSNIIGPWLDKKTLHKPWEEKVGPFLPSILQMLGLDVKGLNIGALSDS